MKRHTLSRLLVMWLSLAATDAGAAQVNPEPCAIAFGLEGGYENPPITPQPATIIPAHPTSNDTLTACTFGFIYADRIAITVLGNRISAVVLDNGFSFSPNPPIVNAETFGPLPPGDYLMDVSVDADFTPKPPGYPYVLATDVPLTVSAADAVPHPAPALGTYGKMFMAAFLVFVGLAASRWKAGKCAIDRRIS